MKVLVVYKKSTIQLYEDTDDPAVRKYLDSQNSNAGRMRRSHLRQQAAKAKVRAIIDALGWESEWVYRADLDERSAREFQLVVSLGGDGTFLEASHFVRDETPLLGVNSDPKRSVGFFSTATLETVQDDLTHWDKSTRTRVQRIEIAIDGKALEIPVLNDVLFAHPNPAATTRYTVRDADGLLVSHRNSGVLASTAAGSSAWMHQENGEIMPLDDPRVQYLHRGERGARALFADSLELESQTRAAMVYLDGEHIAYRLSLGQRLSIHTGIPLLVSGDLSEKRRNVQTSLFPRTLRE